MCVAIQHMLKVEIASPSMIGSMHETDPLPRSGLGRRRTIQIMPAAMIDRPSSSLDRHRHHATSPMVYVRLTRLAQT